MKKIIALVLMLSMLFSLFAVPMGALAQENDNNFTISQLLAVSSEDETTESEDSRVWFDLEGNSELFMLYDTNADSAYSTRTSRRDFTPGVDFGGYLMNPTGDKEADYATITGTSTNNMGCFPYTLSAAPATINRYTASDFTKDADNNVWWEIEGVSYKVDVDSKVIKLYPGVDTSLISASTTLTQDKKDELIADYASLSEMTIDVENQKYSKIGLLAGIVCGQNKNIKVTLVYEDAEETKTVNIKAPVVDKNKSYKDGQMYLIKMNDTSNALRTMGQTVFAPYEIEPISTKVLDKIILKPVSYTDTPKRPIFTISAWGEEADINYFLSAIEEIVKDGITDEDEYNSVKKYIGIIDADGGVMTDAQTAVYESALAAIAQYEENLEEIEKEAEKNQAISNKYTNLDMVGPLDMFATEDDVSSANWKVTSTAAAPNILAYKGWNTSGNIQPSEKNQYAFGADLFEGTNISKKDDGRYYINIGTVPFKLGEIKTEAGERGTNGWIPRGKLTPNTITEGLIPDIATTGDVTYTYGATTTYATNIMKGTFNINNKNISAINFLTTGVSYGASNNRLYDVYVKYEGETIEEHGFMFAGNLTQSVEDAVFAIPASKYYDEIMADESLTSTMKELSAYTVDEINALRGYTPSTTTTVDTSKTIISTNYTLDQLNEVMGLNLSAFPTSWAKDKKGDATFYNVHDKIVATTKQNAVVNSAVALSKLDAGLDTKKLSSAYEDETVAIPTESTSFVKYRRGTTADVKDTFVSYTKYPLDPAKKVVSVRVEANLTDVTGDDGVALGSGGVYSLEKYNLGRGVMLLNYDGQKTVNIKGTEYVLFMKVQRECGDSMFLGATYERKNTIKEEIDIVNEKINAIDENTKVAEIVAIREIIESLKVESAYVTDADFALEKIVSAESTLGERKVKEATEAMQVITLDSTIEEANAAKDLYDYALLDENVTEASFDEELVALFNEIHAKIADKINLKGTIVVKYFKGEAPSADIEIVNTAKFAGKPYKVVLVYYDENDRVLGTYIENRESVKDEKVSFTVKAKADKKYENAVKVKGFIWKDFATLIPFADADEATKKDAFKVLSIGNSYSNNAHKYLVQIAQNAGFEKVIVDNLFIGGCSLDTHAKNAEGNLPAYDHYHKELVDGKVVTSTKKEATMLDGIKSQDWDVITIQQGSQQSGKPETYGKLQSIIDYVNANKTNKDAKIVWHQTWAYADNSDVLASRYNGISQIEMYNRIVSAMESEVLPLDDIDYVIPAGTAVQNARATSLGDTLTDPDAVHLNDLGCYVAGLTWFAKITGMSIDEIDYVPTGITSISDNLDIIKKAVKDAIANPYTVTK